MDDLNSMSKHVVGIDLAEKGGDHTVAVMATRVGDGTFVVNGIDEISAFPDYKWYRNPIKWWKWHRFLKVMDAQREAMRESGHYREFMTPKSDNDLFNQEYDAEWTS